MGSLEHNTNELSCEHNSHCLALHINQQTKNTERRELIQGVGRPHAGGVCLRPQLRVVHQALARRSRLVDDSGPLRKGKSNWESLDPQSLCVTARGKVASINKPYSCYHCYDRVPRRGQMVEQVLKLYKDKWVCCTSDKCYCDRQKKIINFFFYEECYRLCGILVMKHLYYEIQVVQSAICILLSLWNMAH